MKKRYSHILVVFTGLLLCSFAWQADKTYYPTGELESEWIHDSSCSCYHFVEYYKTGEKRVEETYAKRGGVNTLLDGVNIRYFKDGTIMLYEFWQNGHPEGRAYSNFKNGKPGFEKLYKDGYKAGTWKYYNEDGSLRREERYQRGKTRWNSDKGFVTVYHYMNGERTHKEKLENGKVISREILDAGAYEQWQKQNVVTGKRLFTANCAMCHSLKIDIVGPKLTGVTKLRTRQWLVRMIRNGNELIREGDSTANALYVKWQKSGHPDFERLSDKEVDMIIDYLDGK